MDNPLHKLSFYFIKLPIHVIWKLALRVKVKRIQEKMLLQVGAEGAV